MRLTYTHRVSSFVRGSSQFYYVELQFSRLRKYASCRIIVLRVIAIYRCDVYFCLRHFSLFRAASSAVKLEIFWESSSSSFHFTLNTLK